MQIISDIEAIQNLLSAKGQFAVYAGAGVSAEADVLTTSEICEEIRRRLKRIQFPSSATKEEVDRWESETLKWDDPPKRYAACIHQGYPAQVARVDFFRNMLRGKKPSFSHHAIAMLMARGYLRATCITTNFDKLLESAFTQQARRECQAIRSDAEVQYWRSSLDRCYALKLHGDYDTYNVLNTSDEVISIGDKMEGVVSQFLQDSGLVVLGSAGQEKSIYSLFDRLGREVKASGGMAGSPLSYGLLWGVYMGPQKPIGFDAKQIEDLVRERIQSGEVGNDIAEMISRLSHVGVFRFFPVWGAGNFLFDLINATEDKDLRGTAELYLDQKMRLRNLFARKGLSQEAIKRHLSSLDQRRKRLELEPSSPHPDAAFKAFSAGRSLEVRVLYGDITKRSYMDENEFASLRRAIVSPEDTFLSAGGGVALKLLDKAGPVFMLNELAKFAPIDRGAIAISSGGNLPLHYVFHAASIEIENDGSYAVSEEDVFATMATVLEKATSLGIGALWVPLLGAGVASLKPFQSLGGILGAIAAWKGSMVILIFIYQEKELARQEVLDCLKSNLGPSYSIESP